MQSFSAHLEEFARTQSLRLRLDEDLLDSACLDAIESLCERICDGDGSTDVDLVHLYDFLFSADEMFPASARVGYEKHVTALRAAGFGLGTRRKHKRSDEVCDAERSFAEFIAQTMQETGAIERFEDAVEMCLLLKRDYEDAQSALQKFEDENGTAFDAV